MALTQRREHPESAYREKLRGLLAGAGISVDERALAVMDTHFELLMRWNRKVNLTAIRDPEQVLRRHFVESLHLTRYLNFGPGLLYDMGSGAGFPGLPLKAAHPQVKLVMVESSQKKAAFLKEVIRTAGLESARVETQRVEKMVERSEVELADWITMRAVGQVEEMLRLFRRLLVVHGQVALFLGAEDAEGIRTGTSGYAWETPVRLPGSERRVILIGQHLG